MRLEHDITLDILKAKLEAYKDMAKEEDSEEQVKYINRKIKEIAGQIKRLERK